MSTAETTDRRLVAGEPIPAWADRELLLERRLDVALGELAAARETCRMLADGLRHTAAMRDEAQVRAVRAEATLASRDAQLLAQAGRLRERLRQLGEEQGLRAAAERRLARLREARTIGARLRSWLGGIGR